jgi:hypothetical protein
MATISLWFKEARIDAIIKEYAPDGNYKMIGMPRYSCRIQTKTHNISVADKYTGQGLLKLIMWFRHHVRERMENGLIDLSKDGTPYYKSYGHMTKKWEDSEEVDMSQAHATSLYKIGGLDDRMYMKLRGVAKASRLMIVGALGSRRSVAVYEGGKQISVEERVEPTHPVYEKVCSITDMTMQALAAHMGDDFQYYYWDAIFVVKGTAQKAVDFLREHGYASKIRPCRIRSAYGKLVTDDGRSFDLDDYGLRRGLISSTDKEIVA